VETTNLNLTDRRETRDRYGAGLSFDLNILGGTLLMNNMLTRQNRDEDQWVRQFNTNTNSQNLNFRDTQRTIYTLNNSLSGDHRVFGIKADWGLSRSATLNRTPFDHRVNFNEPSALELAAVDLSEGPHVLPQAAKNRVDLVDLANVYMANVRQKETDLSANINVEVPLVLGSWLSGYVKVGGKHYHKERFRENLSSRLPGYELDRIYNFPGTTSAQRDNDFPWEFTTSGNISIRPFIPDLDRSYSILDGQYTMQFLPDKEIANQLWEKFGTAYLRHAGDVFDDYDATERLSAGYAMTELHLFNRLMILPGARYELDHSTYTTMVGTHNEKDDDLHEDALIRFNDSTATRNIGQWYPMVQARLRVTDWLDIRAARIESASRPSFHDVSPRYRVNFDGGYVRKGETHIRPATARNYDLFASLHHNLFGLLTIGGFYKEIDDLIYTRNAIIIDPADYGLPIQTTRFDITHPVNNPNMTSVKGFELEWQSNLLYLPAPFNGLVINANLSRFFSETQYPSFEFRRTPQGIVGIDTFRVGPMIHQADLVANLTVRGSMQYQGPTLRSVGDRPETDQFTDAYLRFDATLRQTLPGGRARMVVNLHNITNREERSSQFTYDRPRNIEYYGAGIDVGIEYRF
jgi:TonB-dependent receptor